MLFYRVIVYYSTSVLLLLQHVNISSVGSIKSNLITANLIYRTDEIVPALYNLWIFANIIYEDTKYFSIWYLQYPVSWMCSEDS